MNKSELIALIKRKQSFLCIGLDTDISLIPPHLHQYDDPVFEFNKQIIDATHHLAVAYKPNTAFYEHRGAEGWLSLEKTMRYLDQYRNSVFTIADAKRGDIGNTSSQYARAFLASPPAGLGFDSITVAPYMGSDSVQPFLKIADKWVILLALTSNQGSFDFQTQRLANGKQLFEQVIESSKSWANSDNMMYVVGATRADMLAELRKLIPSHFLLVPGVGAQGGSLADVCKHGFNAHCGLLVNSSRGIIYASSEKDFANAALTQALALQTQMAAELQKAGLF